MDTVVAWYAIGVGGLMAVWWAIDLSGGALNRPDRHRVEIELHLAAEIVTAAALATGGVAMLAAGSRAIPLAAAALGMLFYTVIVSPGYFLARDERAPAALFGVLAVLTAAALVVLVV